MLGCNARILACRNAMLKFWKKKPAPDPQPPAPAAAPDESAAAPEGVEALPVDADRKSVV